MPTCNQPPPLWAIGIILKDGSKQRMAEMQRQAIRLARKQNLVDAMTEQIGALRSGMHELTEPTGDDLRDRKRMKEAKRMAKRADKYNRKIARLIQKG